ncbi:MAG TPA: SAM-dependent methyltransferase [Trebonia sp.]|nr:SAM-dependent methyltransferase [Trebonia sp.]
MADFDPKKPSIARVYDYVLGGKDNFAADRELAEQLIALFPPIVTTAKENKEFLDRAVTAVAGRGIRQFIDVGCGMPTLPSTYSSARAVEPEARVAYIDNDPIVISHLSGPLSADPMVTIIDGDARQVDTIIEAASADLDLSQPAGLIIAAMLHFFDLSAGRDLVAGYAARLAPGSLVILSMLLANGGVADEFFGRYSQGPARLYQHSADDFASFFGDLELIPPGIADARTWRAEWSTVPVPERRDAEMIVGVARVP